MQVNCMHGEKRAKENKKCAKTRKKEREHKFNVVAMLHRWNLVKVAVVADVLWHIIKQI